MWKNYLKIAWRSLLKHRFYTVLNIVGLSTGLASCLLISLYVVNELSYDRFFDHADRIFRVDARIKFGDKEVEQTTVPAPLAVVLQEELAQVEAVTRILKPTGGDSGGMYVRRPDEAESQKEQHVAFADSTFLRVFSMGVLEGDAHTAFAAPNTVVLTSEAAKKYFGSGGALDKTLIIDGKTPYTVSAVIEDIPKHSHLAGLSLLFSMPSLPASQTDDWLTHTYHTYLLLGEGADVAEFEKNLEKVVEKHVGTALQSNFGISQAQFGESGNYLHYSLFPLTDIHLHSNKTGEIGVNGNSDHVYIFSVVAVFLLMIACVNFMNLATARSSSRINEIGVRKTLGSARLSLVKQFLTESTLLGFLSVLVGLVLSVLFLPFFNALAARELLIPYQSPVFWAAIAGTALFVGLLAGSYPALSLSGVPAVSMLKKAGASPGSNGPMRNALVVFQFAISIVLIASTGVIFNQLRFMQSKPLGFDREQVLIVSDAGILGSQADSFKQKVLQLSQVESASIGGQLPTISSRRHDIFYPEGSNLEQQGVNMQSWWVDTDYIPTLGMQVVEGRAFREDIPTDSSGVILNEAAVRLLGYDDPIGRQIQKHDGSDKQTLKIIGVVRDFHFESLRENVRPLALNLRPHQAMVAIRLSAEGNTPETLRQVEKAWKEIVSEQPFQYRFMDEDFDRIYQAEQNVGSIFVTFAALSILIACLGLFGLAAFTAERRTKEIGVRKVLGASVSGIVRILSKDFAKPVLSSLVIATPLAWWAMNQWLRDFAYRIDLEWWMFASAGLVAMGLALATVSFQAVKAALMNPVESLRSE